MPSTVSSNVTAQEVQTSGNNIAKRLLYLNITQSTYYAESAATVYQTLC